MKLQNSYTRSRLFVQRLGWTTLRRLKASKEAQLGQTGHTLAYLHALFTSNALLAAKGSVSTKARSTKFEPNTNRSGVPGVLVVRALPH